MTFYFKVILPTFWFGVLGLFAISFAVNGVFLRQPFTIAVVVGMALGGYLIMRKLVLDLKDEVRDYGDKLLVRNRGLEAFIDLAEIINVSISYSNPTRVTLKLASPSVFGNEISFTPKVRFTLNPFAKNAVAEDLIMRVDKARVRRAV
ncbi:MAG: hypothetical protein KF822_11305 [Steroidobacteraceae bacterium]|nr:hypothetical protein [Steroidobacteraceae bacterium]